MKIINRLTEFNENFKKNRQKELQGYKYVVLGLIGIDLAGVYWYLQWKSGGIAILLVLIGILVYILLHERRLEDKMVFEDNDENYEEGEDDYEDEGYDDDEYEDRPLKKVKKPIAKPRVEQESNDNEDDMGFELPSADEYNKRMEKAFGTFG